MLSDRGSLVHHPRYLPGYGTFQSKFTPPQIQRTLLDGQTAVEHLEKIAAALNELRAKNI